MGKLYVEFNNGVPRFACSNCSHCTSKMGISLCNVESRGCCGYFPKFTLVEIHRMSKNLEGLTILERIVNNPATKIESYEIKVSGIFDQQAYEAYRNQDKRIIDPGYVEDTSIFFKACPFVKGGFGCTIPPEFRTYVCNFFICREIWENIDNEMYLIYNKERERYMRWLRWENDSLKGFLEEENINLVKDYNGTIAFLQGIEVTHYDFPELPAVIIEEDGWFRGA